MYRIQYQYFDSKGNQQTKLLEEKNLKTIINKMTRHFEKGNELYHISHVSPNLTNYNFEKHFNQLYPIIK